MSQTDDYTKWHQSQPDVGLDEAVERIGKAILVMDMPECCHDCTMASAFVTDEGHKTWLCHGQFPFRDLSEVDAPKPDWCPLILMPERATTENSDYGISWNMGWNACLDAIGGGGE